MTEFVPILLSVILTLSCVSALMVRKLVWSLILLFYASLFLGGILFWYGAIYAGLFQITTFAGAVSVMFMVIIMLTAQETPPAKVRVQIPQLVGVTIGMIGTVIFSVAILVLDPSSNHIVESQIVPASTTELSFIWQYQAWNIIFLLAPALAAILVIVSLFSKESETEQ